jgi:hypothetical protein
MVVVNSTVAHTETRGPADHHALRRIADGQTELYGDSKATGTNQFCEENKTSRFAG